jgi:hypothetical protein
MPSRLMLSAAPFPFPHLPSLASRGGWGEGEGREGIAQDDDCAGAGSALARLRK